VLLKPKPNQWPCLEGVRHRVKLELISLIANARRAAQKRETTLAQAKGVVPALLAFARVRLKSLQVGHRLTLTGVCTIMPAPPTSG
jgi:hypothetical protein